MANDIQPSHTTGPEYDVVRDGADWVFTIKDNDEYANYYFEANAEKVLRVPVGEEPSTAADCPSPVIPDVAQTSQCGVEGVVYLPENTDLITPATPVGWILLGYQRSMEPAPDRQKRIDDISDQIAVAEALAQRIADDKLAETTAILRVTGCGREVDR